MSLPTAYPMKFGYLPPADQIIEMIGRIYGFGMTTTPFAVHDGVPVIVLQAAQGAVSKALLKLKQEAEMKLK